MDRYVLVISFCQNADHSVDECKCVESLKSIYDNLLDMSVPDSEDKSSVFPACSLSGCPSAPRWFFAVQACHTATQFCTLDWEELKSSQQKSDSEEDKPSPVEECLTSLSSQAAADLKDEESTLTELLDEAAEGLHLLSDKLPPPGKALVDVLLLAFAEQTPPLKELLPLLGALKHMSCWHAAKITLITQNTSRWQKVASSLSAGLLGPADLFSCIDHREMWRGSVVIREKKCGSELRFDGFSLRLPELQKAECNLLLAPCASTDQRLHSEVFHYYASSLDLIQIVHLSDLPSFLMSSTQLELCLLGKSMKAKLLMEQLRSLRGKVGALFSLSCRITPITQPAASQLSSQRWKESLAKGQKSLLVPDMETKGESAAYFLLVQGSDDDESGVCRVRMMHSTSQINGVAAMATVSGLLREKPPSAEVSAGAVLHLLPCLQGDGLLQRERKLARVQTLALKEYFKGKEEASASSPVSVSDLKTFLNLVREQYLKVLDSTLPKTASCLTKELTAEQSGCQTVTHQLTDWPEKSVLQNIESLQKRRQKRKFDMFGSGSSDSLLGPKDSQRSSSALLDAKELLKYFTADGLPCGDLQPLTINRGNKVFQLSPDLSPGRVSRMPFSKASTSHYHGLEFCLDNQRSLDRDQVFARLQSRLIRYETQTTCSKEPCALPFALSPAPSPALISEPGSVPDGEALLNSDVARLKRRSWEADMAGGPARRKLVKSESSDSFCSQSSNSSGVHPTVRTLRHQPSRSQSTSTTSSVCTPAGSRRTTVSVSAPDGLKVQQQKTSQGNSEDKRAKESRSQKHNRMLEEVVGKTLKHHGISVEHECYEACSKRLFEISKFYLKDLKTSRGLYDEMKKAASSNVKQVIDWVLEKTSKNGR
ncbi:Mdm2-binding protein [Oryzias melastigma]|nr:mdm2-binding protein isoform X1 [Oryzias melastigma]KAF6725432.1 Mdm2-binding protein [Oryzias melastigma]